MNPLKKFLSTSLDRAQSELPHILHTFRLETSLPSLETVTKPMELSPLSSSPELDPIGGLQHTASAMPVSTNLSTNGKTAGAPGDAVAPVAVPSNANEKKTKSEQPTCGCDFCTFSFLPKSVSIPSS